LKIARQDFLKWCTAPAALRTIFEIAGQDEIELNYLSPIDYRRKVV